MHEFDTFEDFVTFITEKCVPAIPGALHKAVSEVGDNVLQRTKHQIGHYLDGPEPGLPTTPLADETVGDRIARGFTPDDPGFRTGDMQRSYERSVSEKAFRVETAIGSDDDKAFWFELGRGGKTNQPPRPELSVAMRREEQHSVELVTNAVGSVMAGLHEKTNVQTIIPLDGSD